MATPTATTLAGATFLGTAVTGTNGVASVLYKMNTLPSPPLPGTRIGFAAVYPGSGDMEWGNSKSPTVSRLIVKRAVVNTLTAQRQNNVLSGTVRLTEANVQYTTVSNNVSTTTTMGGVPVRNAPVVIHWLNASGGFVSSFTLTTNTNGIANLFHQIPSAARKARANFVANNKYLAKTSNTVSW
jgi:hypothetical protein